jgi:SAM-dependent methyltransferase
MSLAAHVLGLGTFWITQMGDREKVREIVGLPEDRLVVAVLALGYPKIVPKKGPKRRPMAHVTHHNYYAGRPIPSSTNPADWESDLLAVYQRARVLNGLRHNKPRAWEARAIVEALDLLVPEGRAEADTGSSSPTPNTRAAADTRPRWLDVLPCTGIVTERLWRERQGFVFDIVERTAEVAEFVSLRMRPHAGSFGWVGSAPKSAPSGESRRAEQSALPRASGRAEDSAPPLGPGRAEDSALPAPADRSYDVVSCIFRLENLPPAERAQLVAAMARWVKPNGRVLLGFVSKSSFHDLTEWLRGRRGGLGGVEYVLSPDPNIGPFESLEPSAVESLCAAAGLKVEKRYGCQAVPQREEIEFRTRNFSERGKSFARSIGWLLARIEKLPGLRSRRGRFQFFCLRRADGS